MCACAGVTDARVRLGECVVTHIRLHLEHVCLSVATMGRGHHVRDLTCVCAFDLHYLTQGRRGSGMEVGKELERSWSQGLGREGLSQWTQLEGGGL
jgi:hypothetical protein